MKILLIRLRLIGDVVFTTPLIRALRAQFPTGHLAYLVEPDAAPVVQTNPRLNEVIVVPHARGLARVRGDLDLARRLRRAGFDMAIDLHGGPRASWLCRATGAPTRIGYTIAGRSWLYTTLVDRPRALRPRHSVENQWDLLAPIDAAFRRSPDPVGDSVEMFEDAEAVGRIERRLAGAHLGHTHRLIVLHVSAGNPFRRWPLESFANLAVALARRDTQRRIVLTAGPSDAAAAAQVANHARSVLGSARADSIPPFGELSLAELRALVQRAALFIGGDSGPLHVASTTGAPIVGLFGPTLPARSAPWRDPAYVTESVDVGELACRPCDQRRCLPGDFRCLTGLSVEAAVAAAERACSRSAGVLAAPTLRYSGRSS